MKTPPKYIATLRMRDLVKDNSLLVLVISRFSMSLGFGEKTVREVCRLHNVDEQTFLAVANYVSGKECEIDSISLPSLMGYLKNAHEYFLEFNLPRIRRKLLEALDCSSPNGIAILILRFFDEYVSEVVRHMRYENDVVFTYVEQLAKGYLDQGYDIASIDNTGAGDLFASGFLYGYVKGWSLRQSLHLGSLIAEEVIQVYGSHMSDERWAAMRATAARIEG